MEKNYAEKLYEKIWKTKGARLEAHKRLERTNKYSNWSTSLASLYVIVFSLQSFTPFKIINLSPELINLSAILFSIFIIIMSLIENSGNYKSLSDQHHQCAKDLNKNFERLEQIKERYVVDKEIQKEIEEIGINYQNLINTHIENHSENDFKLFVLKDQKNTCFEYLFKITDQTTKMQYLLNLVKIISINIRMNYIYLKSYFIYIFIFISPIIVYLYILYSPKK